MSTRTAARRALAVGLAAAALVLPGLTTPALAATTPAPPASATAPPPAAAPPVESTPPLTTTAATSPSVVVSAGDTLTSIALAAGTEGGWPTLYAANRAVIGTSPDLLLPGTVLELPTASAPAAVTSYAVVSGDSLRDLAERFGVAGGWPALYEANRAVVGPDPDLLPVGVQLSVPAASAGAAVPAAPPAPPSGGGPAQDAPPSSAAPSPPALPVPSAAAPAAGADTASGVPPWVVWPLVAVALLAGAVLVGDPLLALLRRAAARRAATGAAAVPAAPADAGDPAAGGAGVAPSALRAVPLVEPVAAPPVPVPLARPQAPLVVVREHSALLVSYSPADDLVVVLVPQGQDVDDVLQVARVALPERAYRAVERRLPTPLRRTGQGVAPVRWAV